MDDELFNRELRKFLKHFGVTAQREIERVVYGAIEAGTLAGSETLSVHATLAIDGLGPVMRLDGRIALAGGPTGDRE